MKQNVHVLEIVNESRLSVIVKKIYIYIKLYGKLRLENTAGQKYVKKGKKNNLEK